MKSYKETFVNTTNQPVIIDDDGRILGGHEWSEIPVTVWTDRWEDAGYLVRVTDRIKKSEPEPPDDPAPVAPKPDVMPKTKVVADSKSQPKG